MRKIKPTHRFKKHSLATLRTPGVYVLFKGNCIVYVSQSQDVQQRIREHAWPTSANKHAYRGGFDHYAILERQSPEERKELERSMIAFYRPEGNILHQLKSRVAFLATLSDPFFAPIVHQSEMRSDSSKEAK